MPPFPPERVWCRLGTGTKAAFLFGVSADPGTDRKLQSDIFPWHFNTFTNRKWPVHFRRVQCSCYGMWCIIWSSSNLALLLGRNKTVYSALTNSLPQQVHLKILMTKLTFFRWESSWNINQILKMPSIIYPCHWNMCLKQPGPLG